MRCLWLGSFRLRDADKSAHITLRPLNPSEWVIVKDLRLQALKSEPGVFVSSFDAEALLSPEQWQETIQGADHQVFGLFDRERLIGLTAVFTSRDDPSGQTAQLAYSFIIALYRSSGLSRLLYEGRLNWIKSRPQFKCIVVSHRASNERSRRAILRHRFAPSGESLRVWPDGTTERELFYEIDLRERGQR